MVELIVKVVGFHLVADHPWILWIVGAFALLWLAGWIMEARERKTALRAKRQEAVDVIAAYRDRVARDAGDHPNA